MKKLLIAVVALVAVIAFPAIAGEWHAGTTNLCSDCHTMHFSMQHNWDGTTPVSTTSQPGGNWLGASGPNHRLLKLPANQLCEQCHDGQTFAPDVLGVNANASPVNGRSAGGPLARTPWVRRRSPLSCGNPNSPSRAMPDLCA